MKLPNGIIASLCLLFIFGCEKAPAPNWTLQKSRLKHSFVETQRALLTKVKSAGEVYMDDINFFNNLPAQFALEDCQTSWKGWYNEFLLLSPYRYFSGDLDVGFEDNQSFYDLSGINYSYVDYTNAQPNSGIIKDGTNYPTINQVGMISWHQAGGDKNAALGFHVLEFLLWGEDQSFTSAGTRSNNDYLQVGTENERRMKYLVDASDYLQLLINDFDYDSNYENSLLELDEDEAFNIIIDGYMRFIEKDLVEKTILKPLESQNPQDELSDFSDNTTANIKAKVKALRYALDGSDLFSELERTWYFMIDFIDDVDNEAAQDIMTSLDEVDDLLGQINMDFEQAIQDAVMREKLGSIISELTNIHAVLEKIKSDYSAVG